MVGSKSIILYALGLSVFLVAFVSISSSLQLVEDLAASTGSLDLYHLLEAYSVSSNSKSLFDDSTNDDMDYQSIAEKWQMPSDAIPILREIRSRPIGFDYNRDTDILSLRHPLKTGGTSFSLALLEIFTKNRVMPGSGKSHWFRETEFETALEKHPPDIDPDYWRSIGTLYTHTFLRRINQKEGLLEKLRREVPLLKEKRFRLMTIVRRPLDLAASRFYETKCRIGVYSGRKAFKNVSSCTPVNLTAIKYQMLEEKEECLAETRKARCPFLVNKSARFFDVCGSIDALLEIDGVHDLHDLHYRDLMGLLPTPPSHSRSKTSTFDDVARYTIRDLGGLIDANENYKEDFMMFLITERMKESLCLFYYHLKIEPVKERHSLYKTCRPLDFWEERQKRSFIETGTFDYTVWRAANAVMDVRMAAFRMEIKARLDAGETLDQIPFLGPACYDDTQI
uniref:Sulfotransferase domain-containing protein n=1 Tax=Pseudo-nitzschia australis TaxID=44445 RepID=A0A7S4AB24_9STRA|mmetsp:Transcript_9101/g.19681  ORF Transcript_9101/g.19681 Transcript_9101/m.19681 type:complete len:452 (+) Transcript_9101:84-1439(+)|eukprot:CAMPEP_0168204030 /NCGR_PEP_ID=MMETSP0139_2-20121125/25179_1 /TAXON_ID=44445 /ORGANISM="Pseudo-nitzschia australis, Strain 10249 10 AB" /LENGTH=451 /DNA_ID=CAMNT_0008129939 /DNA_START=61 /DNA_END=1416 /DNA_ORIENTATION=+